ncbi:shikimate dehydrogenase [Clostridium saccharobutylicum]|nr:shikimate dehydrogenase [Clostridium saccharobutylicum]AQS08614.1 shikimate dehydrogenase [Clostridium saccharobutylicum]MBA2904003.1 shikimate dehydrogenase [Clostridium saccharobutylicum]MBA8992850.1 shikimate dehydrogenase [Clostridium saccharobutylicum]MBC2436084.1 shikimate dehydrogenase [Clostridium saccharobutylicum]MBC2469407.1 shikimate dehydrogenase [Clostridium saccharobutylicum]
MGERITGKTQLTGLLGTPVSHSISPIMHNESFAKLGLDFAYLAFNVGNEGVKSAVEGLRTLNARGFNVTMPNKTVICQYLDKLSPAAELAGAVNTVVNDNGVLTGHITDGTGYMRSLKEAGIDIIGKKMTIVGAGGAATAIEIQAALDGVKEISIFNIKDEFFERAKKTVQDINEKTNCKATLFDLEDKETLRREIANSAILTNATGIGMKPYEGQTYVEKSMLRSDLIVSDVIYNPEKTTLLEMAEEIGCTTINGLGMLLWQGARAFEIWTGKEMPVDYIKKILF